VVVGAGVCVCERERERERGSEGGREGERERERAIKRCFGRGVGGERSREIKRAEEEEDTCQVLSESRYPSRFIPR
jgi:hypothetical protein